MEKVNYPKTLLAIMVGITGALLLILNIWGAEWYKIAISILLGIISGLLIADYKISINILRTVAEELISIVILMAITRNDRIHKQRMKKVALFLINPILFFTLIAVLLLPSFSFLILASNHHYEILTVLALITVVASAFIIILFIQSCHPENWRQELSREEVQRIWKNIFYKKLSFRLLIRICPNMNALKMEKAIFLSIIITMNKKSKKLFGNLYEGLVITFFFLIFIAIDLIVYLLWIIKKIGGSGYPLLVSASIVTGSLVGVISQSLFYGVLTGVSLFSLSYLCAKVIKKLTPFYLVRQVLRCIAILTFISIR